MQEEWRDISGYEGHYQVSNLGRVRSLDRMIATAKGGARFQKGIIRKQQTDHGGYRYLPLSKDGEKTHHRVHALVAQAFIGPRPDNHDINHKNGVRFDNRVENLEYLTRKENNDHARRELGSQVGLPKGAQHYNAEATMEKVRKVRQLYLAGDMSIADIAEEVSLSQATVTTIARGQSWRWLDDYEPPPPKTCKLNMEVAREIRRLHKQGYAVKELAKLNSVSRTTIYNIINKVTYTE